MNPHITTLKRRTRARAPGATQDHLLRQGILKLLSVKDSDIRRLTLEQCRDAVDKSLHAGGAFSATIPLVALYYDGFMDVDVADPTRPGQDLFVLDMANRMVFPMPQLESVFSSFDWECSRRAPSAPRLCWEGPFLPPVEAIFP